MAIQLIPDGSGILLKLSRLTDEFLLESNNTILEKPNFESLTHVISDFSEAPSSELTVSGVRKVAELNAQEIPRNPGLKVAIVANKQVIRGLTNVYRVYLEQAAETGNWDTQYFETIQEARRWID